MMIIELKDKIPTVTGNAASTSRGMVESHLDTPMVTVTKFQGSPVWCRSTDVTDILTYWDGKYTAPEEHFT